MTRVVSGQPGVPGQTRQRMLERNRASTRGREGKAALSHDSPPGGVGEVSNGAGGRGLPVGEELFDKRQKLCRAERFVVGCRRIEQAEAVCARETGTATTLRHGADCRSPAGLSPRRAARPTAGEVRSLFRELLEIRGAGGKSTRLCGVCSFPIRGSYRKYASRKGLLNKHSRPGSQEWGYIFQVDANLGLRSCAKVNAVYARPDAEQNLLVVFRKSRARRQSLLVPNAGKYALVLCRP